MKPRRTTTEAFEEALANPGGKERYVLRLFVTGMTPRSTEALRAIREICETHLPGRYELEIIDIYQHPELARDEQIVAVPTLIKMLPSPMRRLIGNLSTQDRVLIGLDLKRVGPN